MGVGNAFLASLLDVVFVVLEILQWTVLVWVILSWILFFTAQSSARWRYRKFFGLLVAINDIFERFTRPILKPFRKLLPAYKTAGVDWSPLLLLLTIYFLQLFLRRAAAPILY
jgi:YggT family protein